MVTDRLREYIEHKGISYYAFENSIGASRGSISKAVKENKSIGSSVLENILNIYQDINPNWLLTGKGAMIIDQTALRPAIQVLDQSVGVPYYDVDFCGGFEIMVNDQTSVPAGYINIPQYNKADSWTNITGHSMEPLISHGDMIALKKVEDWRTYILYGEIYGIMTEEWRTVKRVRKAENPDNIILEPINKNYDSSEIPKSIITGVWQVLGCAKKLF